MNLIKFSKTDEIPPFFLTKEIAWELNSQIIHDVQEQIPFSVEICDDSFVWFHFGLIREKQLIEFQKWFSSKILNEIKWVTTPCESGVIASLCINFPKEK